jgi:uncharacterized protein
MMHPHTEVRFINDDMGYGVVATRFIPKGTITWVQDELDRVFTTQEVQALKPAARVLLDKFSFRNNKGHYVLCWDQAKYVNHSFKANCLSTAYDFELAVRDIPSGEQLTDDYGYLNVSEPFKANNEGTERNTVFPDDLLKYHTTWDKQLLEAYQSFNLVRQPLQSFVPVETLKKVKQSIRHGQPFDSILTLYCGEKDEYL